MTALTMPKNLPVPATVPALPALPAVSSVGSLSRYLVEIRRFPLLEPQEEHDLAVAWREHGNVAAAHRLVTSHLRLVAKVAMSFRGYGLPLGDLIAEGNIGLMQAVKKFEPERGFRLATYAIWWIRASIQEYVLRSWSLVKMGTSAGRKRLFFNLKRVRNLLQRTDGDLHPENVAKIAADLEVSEQDVIDMDRRLHATDASLNAPMRIDGDGEWMDVLADETLVPQDVALSERQEQRHQSGMLNSALDRLNDRERDIFTARRLSEDPDTLEVLSQKYSISRERVRQIEARAFEKVQQSVLASAQESAAA